ncbi:hypothetical protein GCM10010149_19920 [Nonomuraea roseoviolacea subsp. roseoviolacea]
MAGVRAFLDLWRRTVIGSDYAAGCPVLAVAVEEPPGEGDPEAITAAMCRAERDIRPLDDVAAQPETLIGAAVTT